MPGTVVRVNLDATQQVSRSLEHAKCLMFRADSDGPIADIDGLPPKADFARCGWRGVVLDDQAADPRSGPGYVDVTFGTLPPTSVGDALIVGGDARVDARAAEFARRFGVSAFVMQDSYRYYVNNLAILMLEKGDSAMRTAGRMFLRIDLLTHGDFVPWAMEPCSLEGAKPSTLEIPYRLLALQAVFNDLAGHVHQRWLGNHVNGQCTGGCALPSYRHMSYVSALVVNEINASYPATRPWTSAPAGVAEAFDLFHAGLMLFRRFSAAGGLAFSDGAPDGPAVLLWTEFALAACRRNVDRDVWEALLPMLLNSISVYRMAYGDPARALPLADYQKNRERGPSPVGRGAIGAPSPYQGQTLDQLDDSATAIYKSMLADGYRLYDESGSPPVSTTRVNHPNIAAILGGSGTTP